jgi:cytochrome c oxidase assembly protein subunit 15
MPPPPNGRTPTLDDSADATWPGGAPPRTAAMVRWWMVASAMCVVLTLVVGGVTRLTESGLSITEWKPVSGVLPPLSDAAWNDAYQRYLQIPEAQTVHRGISLGEFKTLFWWEWLHRLVARLAGLVIALPYLVLLLTGRVPRSHRWQLLSLPILTAAQGALGWYMVKSGLAERTDVSQYRLVAHLGLALCIYVIAVRTALVIGTPASSGTRAGSNRGALTVALLAFATILSGGFVAGLDAGHIYNSFPMMGDGLIPPGYAQLVPLWRNWFENPAAVQFNHRVLAIATLVVACLTWARERQRAPRAWNAILAAAFVQVALGIGTLLLEVPVPVAALHQLGAVALLTAALRAERAAPRSAAYPASQPASSSPAGAASTSASTVEITPGS